MKFNLKRNVFETTHCSVASKRKTQNSILQIPICLMHNIKFKITSVEIQFVLQEPISLFQNRHNQQFCSQMTWRFRNMKEKKNIVPLNDCNREYLFSFPFSKYH